MTQASPTIDKPADNILKGVLFLLGFCVLAPVMDANAKYLATLFPVAQIVWTRFAGHMIIAIPIALYYHRASFLRPGDLKTQIARSVLLMIATFCFFTGLKYMPMASNLALAFVTPFIVTAFSGLILGEKVGIRRWSAVIVGFGGVLIILQPGGGLFTVYALFPLMTGITYAFYVMLTRKMAGTDPPLVTLAYTSVTAAIFMTLYMAVSGGWIIPPQTSAWDWGLLISIGAWAMLSHLCLIKAFEYAPASALSPFLYFEMVLAVLLGYVFFGDFPSASVWLGILVIIGSGIYISWREHKLSKPKFFKERR